MRYHEQMAADFRSWDSIDGRIDFHDRLKSLLWQCSLLTAGLVWAVAPLALPQLHVGWVVLWVVPTLLITLWSASGGEMATPINDSYG
jgi:hypothetical protein